MKLIVFGSTGGIDRNIVQQALDEGHEVIAIARTPLKLGIEHPNLTIVKGDVFQPATFNKAKDGQDAVLSAIGVNSTKPTTIYSEGISNIVQAMKKRDVHRIMCISASAVETSPLSSFLLRLALKFCKEFLRICTAIC